MPADQAQPPHEILRTERGALSWGPAAKFEEGALALVDRVSDRGEVAYSLVRLDTAGRLIGESKRLALERPHPGGAIVVLGPDRALVVVLDRKEERPTVNGMLCCLFYDQPRWFLCSWNEQSVELEEVAFWKGIAAGNMSANHHGGITSWTMWMTAYERKPELSAVSRLAFGFASGSRPPETHSTDVPCQGVAHVIESQDRILALVNSGYEEIKLWRLTADGRVTEVSVISPRGQRKGEVSEPAIISLADGYVFLWRYFNKKLKRLQRDGGLWFRSCDRTLSRFDEPQRLSDDREIPTGKWIANDLGGSGLVVWTNGLSQSKQQIRFVTIRLRSELPKPPQVFPGELPKHLLATRRGVLALSTVSSEKPYFWSLRSQSYGDLG